MKSYSSREVIKELEKDGWFLVDVKVATISLNTKLRRGV